MHAKELPLRLAKMKPDTFSADILCIKSPLFLLGGNLSQPVVVYNMDFKTFVMHTPRKNTACKLPHACRASNWIIGWLAGAALSAVALV